MKLRTLITPVVALGLALSSASALAAQCGAFEGIQFNNGTGQTINVTINGYTTAGHAIPTSGYCMPYKLIYLGCLGTGNTSNCSAIFSFNKKITNCSSGDGQKDCVGSAVFNATFSGTNFVSKNVLNNKYSVDMKGTKPIDSVTIK